MNRGAIVSPLMIAPQMIGGVLDDLVESDSKTWRSQQV
jgi:hypothetical protein